MLLHKNSYHPKHTYKGIVKSHLLRFHRICSRREDFSTATRVFTALSSRRYSRSYVHVQKDFHRTKEKEKTTLLPIIVDCSTSAMKLIRTTKNSLREGTQNTDSLSNCKLIAAFRSKNLKDYLVPAKVPSLTQIRPECKKKKKHTQ